MLNGILLIGMEGDFVVEDKPYIHLFETPLGYYVYDVNTNDILKVEENIYKYLKEGKKMTKEVEHQIRVLQDEGYLKSGRVKETEHPATELIPFYLNTKVGQLILQVTQNCNLRCEYCIYSGNYNTREHSKKVMKYETAIKAIDFLFAHSKERKEIVLGFYGGEPLLEFDLIEKCVSYAEQIKSGKKLTYTITTNGTLINSKIIEFLIKHQFMVTISIDGPREIHDQSRKFAGSDRGSFDIMIENIKRIREKSEQYFNQYIRFNAVLLTNRSFNCVDLFFRGNELFSDFSVSANIVSDSFSKNKKSVCSIYIEEQQYELFKFYLSKIEKLNPLYVSPIFNGRYEYMKRKRGGDEVVHRNAVPSKWHRGGPCIPGMFRTFVTVDEKLLPCEKVCEISRDATIGNLDSGYDFESVKKIMNIEKHTEEQCHDCWAYSECTSCIQCFDENKGYYESIINKCKNIKKDLEHLLKDYTVLRELGCGFEDV